MRSLFSPVITLRSSELSWREADEEIFVMDERTWEYLSIGGSGTVIWKRIAEGGASLQQLTDVLVASFGIDGATAAADVDEFVELLRSRELLA